MFYKAPAADVLSVEKMGYFMDRTEAEKEKAAQIFWNSIARICLTNAVVMK